MAKIAIIIDSNTESLEALGRVSNAFVLAQEAVEKGDDLQIVFEGAGTRWIGALEKSDHKLHTRYEGLKDRITGACNFCSTAFGVAEQVKKAGVPLLSEFHDHASLRSRIDQGYEVILY